jgi:putative N6-adenine-specific DNA methylase
VAAELQGLREGSAFVVRGLDSVPGPRGLEAPSKPKGLPAPTLTDLSVIPGGVSFNAKLPDAYLANLTLRSANRVLLRVLSGAPAGAPEAVFALALGVPWELYLAPAIPLVFQLSARASRIKGDAMLLRPFLDGLTRHFQEAGLTPPPVITRLSDADSGGVQRFMLRLESNRLTVSLDSSGEHLHRRGYRLEPGAAPLRETLAAGLLLWAGYDGTRTLVDPMCGSGTVSIEAASIAAKAAPALGRSFLFQAWPSYREASFNHLVKVLGGGAGGLEAKAADGGPKILASDISPQAVSTAKRNAANGGFAAAITVATKDFFNLQPPAGAPGLVFLNPPYGLRLASRSYAAPEGTTPEGTEAPLAQPLASGPFYEAIGARLRTHWAGWKYLILVPDDQVLGAFQRGLGAATGRVLTIPHGGLRIRVASNA